MYTCAYSSIVSRGMYVVLSAHVSQVLMTMLVSYASWGLCYQHTEPTVRQRAGEFSKLVTEAGLLALHASDPPQQKPGSPDYTACNYVSGGRQPLYPPAQHGLGNPAEAVILPSSRLPEIIQVQLRLARPLSLWSPVP